MNSKISRYLGFTPKKVRKKKSVLIIDDEYVIKLKKTHEKVDVYEYLNSRNFLNFPPVIKYQDDYQVTKYLKNSKIDDAIRLEDMIYLLTILHNKTTFYKEVDLDMIKKIYEETVDKLNYLISYYIQMQRIIEEEIYMSPANYYFILHVSKIYRVLNYGLNYIEKWYQVISNKKTMRFVLNHNNLDKEHLIESDNLYLTSWDKSDFGPPEFDLENLFFNNYINLELETLLNHYQGKYKLYNDEYLLLLARLSILKRIDFNKEEHAKMKEIVYFIEYVDKLDSYYLKQNTNETNYQPH